MKQENTSLRLPGDSFQTHSEIETLETKVQSVPIEVLKKARLLRLSIYSWLQYLNNQPECGASSSGIKIWSHNINQIIKRLSEDRAELDDLIKTYPVLGDRSVIIRKIITKSIVDHISEPPV